MTMPIGRDGGGEMEDNSALVWQARKAPDDRSFEGPWVLCHAVLCACSEYRAAAAARRRALCRRRLAWQIWFAAEWHILPHI